MVCVVVDKADRLDESNGPLLRLRTDSDVLESRYRCVSFVFCHQFLLLNLEENLSKETKHVALHEQSDQNIDG